MGSFVSTWMSFVASFADFAGGNLCAGRLHDEIVYILWLLWRGEIWGRSVIFGRCARDFER
jgi:hypothetical protein